MNARTSDLGRGGCYVDTFCPFPMHAPVKLRITRDRKSFVAHAKVVYSKIGMGMGLQFTGIEPLQQPVLDRWITELSGTGLPDFTCEDEETLALPSGRKTPTANSVLGELILALVRKNLLAPDEGKSLLAKLL